MGPGTLITFSGVDYTNISGVPIPESTIALLQHLPGSEYNKIDWNEMDPTDGSVSFWAAQGEGVSYLLVLRVSERGNKRALEILALMGHGYIGSPFLEFLQQVASFYFCDAIFCETSVRAMQRFVERLGAKEEYRGYSIGVSDERRKEDQDERDRQAGDEAG